VRVIGAISDLGLRKAAATLDAQLAVLAIPTASGARIREVVSACRAVGLETKTLPSLQQILKGDVKVSMLRDVAIEDLLRRDPIQLDEPSMASLLRGRRVLVTGGAGSIGSELARQAARYEPSALALLDHNENGLFFLEREMRETFPRLALTPIVADVKDPARISDVLRTFRPHVILHAAAHKHVAMMEGNPVEALKNNVFGTRIVADLANAYGVETFVLISTDKAVNPTSVMGASKRIAEMYLQSLSGRARTRFVTVRFGNVLGSAGSVVPIFREQILRGGPVTITHPDMTRYFMTIPEAAQLVLQAGALAQGGEIFILDMGAPVKIVDLARDMIRMSGLEPDVDIALMFTGARPGEKLFEELLHDHETHDRTVHSKILVGRIAGVDAAAMSQTMVALAAAIGGAGDEAVRAIATAVPEARLDAIRGARPSDVERALGDLERLRTLRADADLSTAAGGASTS
jgi:FlaA1/EpsC-like NDP-sugar epimerase